MNPTMGIPINWLAVLVAAVISMITGYLWYGPLFGNAWMKETGVSRKDMEKNMGMKYGIMFVGAIIMAWVLDHALTFGISYLGFGGVNGAFSGAFFNWLGFVLPVTLGMKLMEDRSWKLWMIQNGYYLITLMLMSVVLVMWK